MIGALRNWIITVQVTPVLTVNLSPRCPRSTSSFLPQPSFGRVQSDGCKESVGENAEDACKLGLTSRNSRASSSRILGGNNRPLGSNQSIAFVVLKLNPAARVGNNSDLRSDSHNISQLCGPPAERRIGHYQIPRIRD